MNLTFLDFDEKMSLKKKEKPYFWPSTCSLDEETH